MKECAICNKGFEPYRSSSIYCDKKCQKTGQRKKCEFCNKGFSSTSGLNRHIKRIHDKDKRCEICNEPFVPKTCEVCCSKECQKEQSKQRLAIRMQDPSWRDASRATKQRYRDKDTSKEKRRVYALEPRVKFDVTVQGSFKKILKGEIRTSIFLKGLNYTEGELRAHFESLFEEGMTWNNAAGKDGWQIDHIRPKSSFNYTTTDCEDFKQCWELSNLQPLWAKDNMAKASKWEEE